MNFGTPTQTSRPRPSSSPPTPRPSAREPSPPAAGQDGAAAPTGSGSDGGAPGSSVPSGPPVSARSPGRPPSSPSTPRRSGTASGTPPLLGSAGGWGRWRGPTAGHRQAPTRQSHQRRRRRGPPPPPPPPWPASWKRLRGSSPRMCTPVPGKAEIMPAVARDGLGPLSRLSPRLEDERAEADHMGGHRCRLSC